MSNSRGKSFLCAENNVRQLFSETKVKLNIVKFNLKIIFLKIFQISDL